MKAEAGTIVEVKEGNKILGSAVADKKGQFSVEIARQKIDNVLSVYSEDQAGNISKVTNEKVKDTTAPIVSGVENNRFYNNNVTITFNEGTAKLDGKKLAKVK